MKKYQKGIITTLGIIVGIFILNIIISTTTGVNVLSNTVNYVQRKMAPNQEEVKSIELSSADYDADKGGSYKIDKSADWTGTDTAQIKFNVDTRMKMSDSYKDVVLVLDISVSMSGDKLAKVKSDAKELTESLLSDKENRVALITFDSTSKIEYELTNNKDELLTKIDSLTATGCTNYNQALLNVDKVLDGYEKKKDRDLIVLFLTDGYPNIETPNQVAQYKMLKEKYPYIIINGIQYEMGKDIIEDIKNISDNQYIASKDTLNNVLFKATNQTLYYDKFELVDYIDNDYFYVESVNDIKVSMGQVELTEEDGVQKVIWTAESDEFQTGSNANMTINLKLKEQYVGTEGYYPTNKKLEVTTKLPEVKEVQKTTDKTPILKAGYKVMYDTNTPDGCDIDNFEETHYAFENVKMADGLTCDGYIFKGWKIIDEVNKVNEYYFIMPTNDVNVKATWTKQEIAKSMNGTVYEGPTLYEAIAEQSVLDNMPSQYVTGSAGIDFSQISSDTNGKGVYTLSSTIGEKYPIHYYRGAVDNNNVIFGNYCWKIIRTTETGGVKLIYNGKPDENGQCGPDRPSHVGYIANTILTLSNGDYYYGTSYTYDSTSNKFALAGEKTSATWSDTTYSDLIGKYTCMSTDANGTCSNVFHITSYNGSTGATALVMGSNVHYSQIDTLPFNFIPSIQVPYHNGYMYGKTYRYSYKTFNWYEFAGKTRQYKSGLSSTSYYYGDSVTYANGTYTLTNPTQYTWSSNYNSLKGKYTCYSTSTTCSTVHYLDSTGSSDAYGVEMTNGETYDSLMNNFNTTRWLYGNDVVYENGTYKLVDTMESSVSNWNNDYETLASKYHYTCMNQTGECSSVYYMHRMDYGRAYYITLSNGTKIEEALKEMTTESTNTTDSTIKASIDKWYQENMTDYTDSLEDTIWCNDRSSTELNGWSKDGDATQDLYYSPYTRAIKTHQPSLACRNKNDAFTVSKEKGNGALTYPVGLLTSDEVMYAGGTFEANNNSYYLNTGQYYWTLSPFNFNYSVASGFFVTLTGNLNYATVVVNFGVGARGVVSLQPKIHYGEGDGTADNPYIIE